MTIVDFIMARLADWERDARKAQQAAESRQSDELWVVTGSDDAVGVGYHPEREVGKCVAIRALIKSLIDAMEDEMPAFERVAEERLVVELAPVAAIWAAHPEYQPEWKS